MLLKAYSFNFGCYTFFSCNQSSSSTNFMFTYKNYLIKNGKKIYSGIYSNNAICPMRKT